MWKSYALAFPSQFNVVTRTGRGEVLVGNVLVVWNETRLISRAEGVSIFLSLTLVE